MKLKFAKNIMSVPAYSRHEQYLVKCIEKWCKVVGIQTQKDGKGNLYLTKGSAEWMPCLVSHLDTVQQWQQKYADEEKRIEVKVDGDKLYCEEGGIGGDCRAGIAVCLAVMKKMNNIKAAFFVEEEIGMQGSKALDKSFFDNVSYCISWDSPTWNRATKASNGVDLFTDEFYETYLKDLCKRHGVTQFNREPYTDVCQIVRLLGITCMNFSNGGYDPHSATEYCLHSVMCKAENMCIDLLNHIPSNKRYPMEYKEPVWPKYDWSSSYSKKSKKKSKEDDSQMEFDFDYDGYDDDMPLSPMEHDETDLCHINVVFFEDEQLKKFEDLAKKKIPDVELDSDGFVTCDIFGELQYVKLAYVLAQDIIYEEKYTSWKEYDSAENSEDFWDNVIFEDDDFDYNDLSPDDEDEGEDLNDPEDFKRFIQRRKEENK